MLLALQAAHAPGIVHGEIGPQSVLVTTGDAVKVLDFGIARLGELNAEMDSAAGATAPTDGAALTKHFHPTGMGQGAEVDAGRDLRGVSAMLFDLLAGWPPSLTASLTSAHGLSAGRPMDPEPVGIVDASMGVPLPLLAVIARGLGGDPSRRFQSVAEMMYVFDQVARTYRIAESSNLGPIKRTSEVLRSILGRRKTSRLVSNIINEAPAVTRQSRSWLPWGVTPTSNPQPGATLPPQPPTH